jgi:serine/threonine protein kinase
MGVVYKARQVCLNRLVALKMIMTRGAAGEALARFRSEAEAIAKLRHLNIIQIYEIGECATGPYFAMELAEGGSLAAHWGGQPQPARSAAEMVATLARALHAAHECGIVHRDVKPDNVLLQQSADGAAGLPSWVLKLSDFGVARRLDDAPAVTLTVQVIGTPDYMAPEQAQGPSSAVGPAADVYALGVLLYEALTGGTPFRGFTALERIQQMLLHEPLAPSRLRPQLTRDLETICLHCLRKEPQRRYASARALAEDVGRFLAGLPIQARPTPAWERAWKWARRRPTVAALAVSIVALAIVSLVVVTGLWCHAEESASGPRSSANWPWTWPGPRSKPAGIPRNCPPVCSWNAASACASRGSAAPACCGWPAPYSKAQRMNRR